MTVVVIADVTARPMAVDTCETVSVNEHHRQGFVVGGRARTRVTVENSPPAKAWLFASMVEMVNRLPTMKIVSAAGMRIKTKNALLQ